VERLFRNKSDSERIKKTRSRYPTGFLLGQLTTRVGIRMLLYNDACRHLELDTPAEEWR